MKAASGALLLLVVASGAVAQEPLTSGNALIDYCVSSRWGFTCFSPPRKAPWGTLPHAIKVARTVGSRGALTIAGAVLAREILRDVGALAMKDPTAIDYMLESTAERCSVCSQSAVAGGGPAPGRGGRARPSA